MRGVLADTGSAFGQLLREHRERRRLSMTALSIRAGVERSYVSRLEAGNRAPSLRIIERLADGLGLDASERDELRASAGFMPADSSSLYAAEPAVMELMRLLQDDSVPGAVQDNLRRVVAHAVCIALFWQDQEREKAA